MTNTDISSEIACQQKQLAKLTIMIYQISKAMQNSSLSGQDQGRGTHLVFLHMANQMTLVGKTGIERIGIAEPEIIGQV